MQFIDTHIHLQDYKSNNAPQIILAAGLSRCICVSAQEADWSNVAALAADLPATVIPAFGLHPWHAAEVVAGWAERLEAKLRQFPKVCVGECGLDKTRGTELELQKQVFAAHIKLATLLQRPLLVHAVKSEELMVPFLPDMRQTKFVLHSFSGRLNFMRKAAEYGAYFSFAPSVLRRKNFAELALHVPAGRLLLESDGPFQGNPSDIPALAAQMAALRGADTDIFAAQIYQNSLEFIND